MPPAADTQLAQVPFHRDPLDVAESNPYRAFQECRFFRSLDGLRALSILSVIWFHAWFGTAQYQWLVGIPVLRSGPFGVDVFFALSGFLITTLLLREEKRVGKFSIRNFYIRRALRIWPLYYTALALYIVLVSVTEHGDARSDFFHFLPGFLTFTYTWMLPLNIRITPHFNFAWSLASEEQFYIFLPLTLVVLRRFWAQISLVGLVCVKAMRDSGVLHAVIPFDSLPDRMMATIPVPICLGALLAFALHHQSGFRRLYPILGNQWSSPLACALLTISLAPYNPVWHWCQWMILALFVGACVIREDHGLAPILTLKTLSLVGGVSFGMYILNLLAVAVVRRGLGHVGISHPLNVFPVAALVTASAAWISYTYYEARFLRLKERWAR